MQARWLLGYHVVRDIRDSDEIAYAGNARESNMYFEATDRYLDLNWDRLAAPVHSCVGGYGPGTLYRLLVNLLAVSRGES